MGGYVGGVGGVGGMILEDERQVLGAHVPVDAGYGQGPGHHHTLVLIKILLLQMCDMLALPANPLDNLIDILVCVCIV